MLSFLLKSTDVLASLELENATTLGGHIAAATGWQPYVTSFVAIHGTVFFLARRGTEKRLCLLWKKGPTPDSLAGFCGERFAARVGGVECECQAGYLDHTNALGLRRHLAFLRPQVMGVRPAFGAGDRLGLATPAHVRAVRGTGLATFFAQQSIREMTRTGRTPDQVLDSAIFGVFQEGWRDGFGADADHLKTTADIDATAAAGFTMFTIDPGDHVDNAAQAADMSVLKDKLAALPWPALEIHSEDLCRRFIGQSCRLPDDNVVAMDEEAFFRAAAKYGRALAHTAAMHRHLESVMGSRPFDSAQGRPFELEMSVDETATPTSVAEHVFVASELRRLGVEWVSLAPRFVGEFEKGVDYIGDLAEFERTFAQHVAVAQHFGPYKISIHSGSDKFSIYPIAARLAGDLIHLKTAGTSYLEALRAIAKIDPALFREILGFAIERYPTDRASYHVSAEVAKVPRPEALADDKLAGVLDQFDGREVLHVTFGSVLTAETEGKPRFKDRLMRALESNEEVHYETVRAHIERHVRPFAR